MRSKPWLSIWRVQEEVHKHIDLLLLAQGVLSINLVILCAVAGRSRCRGAKAPHQSIRARVGAISPEVWTPSDPWNRTVVVIQISRDSIHNPRSHLIDLRLNQPLHGKPGFIGIGFGVAPSG